MGATVDKAGKWRRSYRRRVKLALAASVMALLLCAGGTYMLTVTWSQAATNIVTLGSLDIDIEEKGGHTSGGGLTGGGWLDTEGDGFEGIDYGWLVPTDTIHKEPRVKHRSGKPAFVRVFAEISIAWRAAANPEDDPTETPITMAELAAKPAPDPEDPLLTGIASPTMADLIRLILQSSDTDQSCWEFVRNTDGTGYYYYVAQDSGGEDDGALAILTNGDGSTPPIFHKLTIPGFTPENSNALSFFRLTMELKAEAIQSDNNDYAGDWSAAFDKGGGAL
jgi:hypothetical protein